MLKSWYPEPQKFGQRNIRRRKRKWKQKDVDVQAKGRGLEQTRRVQPYQNSDWGLGASRTVKSYVDILAVVLFVTAALEEQSSCHCQEWQKG